MSVLKNFGLYLCLASFLAACGGGSGGGGGGTPPPASSSSSAPAATTRVDLRSNQTEGEPIASESISAPTLRNQGARTTCITFAATAALEAAYKREGYGNLDLSEEFINYFGKVNWLHPDWPAIEAQGANFCEGQMGFTGGGGSVGWLRHLATRFYSVEETYMPYVDINSYGFGTEGVGLEGPAWNDPFWDVQKNANDFNLDPANYTRDGSPDPRDATEFYSIDDMVTLCSLDSRVADTTCGSLSAADFEAVLDDGYEVAIDFTVAGDRSGAIWQFDADDTTGGGHAMLLVGYDRTDPDNPYFIAKNSWGPTSGGAGGDCGEDGYTCISYGYLQYVYEAGYIVSVNPPEHWNAFTFLGRWDLSFDGHQGTLDIYHVPGAMENIFDIESSRFTHYTDRRLGTYFDDSGTAYRVNGTISDDRIEFYIDPSNPNMRWDLFEGRHFTYYRFSEDSDAMAGFHTDPDGSTWAGYARRSFDGSGFLAPPSTDAEMTPDDFLGEWEVNHDGVLYDLILDEVNAWTHIVGGEEYAQLTGTTTRVGSGIDHDIIALVPLDEPARIQFEVMTEAGGTPVLYGKRLSWEDGVFAGRHTGTETGFYAKRKVPPVSLRITSPTDGASYSRGNVSVYFTAEVQQIDEVQWHSSIDGMLGTGASITRVNLSFGSHVITAVGLNDEGEEIASDSVSIELYNEAPSVSIVSPASGAEFCEGESFGLKADGQDINNWPSYNLPDSAFEWSSSPGSLSATGDDTSGSIASAGSYTITVEATDSGGLSDSDSVTVNIVECTNEAPVVRITEPASDTGVNDTEYVYDGNEEGLWYTDVSLAGTASDLEDGNLTGASLVWRTNQTSLQDALLGTGTSLVARLYSDSCFGVWHEITLTATDSDGNERSVTRRIFIWTLC